MATHHERTLEQVQARYEGDAALAALLVIGSVGAGQRGTTPTSIWCSSCRPRS